MRHLLHVYATFAVGGPQMRLAAILNRHPRRWRHSIIAMDGNTACRERLPGDIAIDFPDPGLIKGDTAGNLWRIWGLLRRMRPDLLVTSNWGSIEWALANRATGVAHLHVEDGFGPEERDRQLPRRVWTRRLALWGRPVVVPSRTLERIATGVWRLDPARVRYLPNGIDLARFAAGPVEHGGPVQVGPMRIGPMRIGTVAALRPEKNLGRLLRAFAAMGDQEARLTIVGDGPARAELEVLARALGVAERVCFAGHQADPSRFYAGFDVFALSSDTEQMPLSVLEAMAAGLPVAATDVGDVKAMLSVENADHVTARDDAALAGALDRLAGDPGRRAIGAANRRKAETDYADETMFAAYATLFDGATLHDSAPPVVK